MIPQSKRNKKKKSRKYSQQEAKRAHYVAKVKFSMKMKFNQDYTSKKLWFGVLNCKMLLGSVPFTNNFQCKKK